MFQKETMAVLSTIHIHPKTADWIERKAAKKNWPIFVLEDGLTTRYLLNKADLLMQNELPSELSNLLEQITDRGLDWLLLDPGVREVNDPLGHFPRYTSEWNKRDKGVL